MNQDLIKVMKVLNDDELVKVKKYVEEYVYKHGSRGSSSEDSALSSFGAVSSQPDGGQQSIVKSYIDEDSEIIELLDSKIKKTVRSYEQILAESNDYYYKMYKFRSPKILRERYNIIKYDTPYKHPWHVDACTDFNTLLSMGERRISVILYLNNDFYDGGTQFMGCTYKPSPGYAIVFPSNESFPHTSDRVLHGTKCVIVTWIHREESRNKDFKFIDISG
tara:strand:+ start:2454 stop:3113 length:660 start_codon:yes stop_codon:yes gene_type:complete